MKLRNIWNRVGLLLACLLACFVGLAFACSTRLICVRAAFRYLGLFLLIGNDLFSTYIF